MTTPLEQIHAAFSKRGQETYGEGVNQLDHGLQCAHFARRDGASTAQVVAALLHDIGHLIHDFPSDIADQGIDTQHESLGSVWLSQFFGPQVTEPVLLHVAAKRYLATAEKGYFETLSEASLLSLRLQGGPMSDQEVKAFEANPYFKEAVALRRWDEEGKIVGFKGPALSDFDAAITSLARKA
jgi:phosphonate degradation associated HDIG domain protein